MIPGQITHELLNSYEQVAGELDKIPPAERPDLDLWDLLEELMMDLHLIQHGYAKPGYIQHTDQRLLELCADQGVIERMKAMRF